MTHFNKRTAMIAAIFSLGSLWAGASPANVAHPPSPGSEAEGTRIILLGTAGGPRLQKNRGQPATILSVDGHLYLFDCGTGTVRQFAKMGLGPEALEAIFITHLHPDHQLGLASLMGNNVFSLDWSTKPRTWQIVGPKGTAGLVDAGWHYVSKVFEAFAMEGLALNTGQSPFRTRDIDANGVVYADERISVTAVENSHYSLAAPAVREQIKSYSYRVESKDAVIVFTGDTGTSDGVAALAKGADVLVSEAIAMPAMDALLKNMATATHMAPERFASIRAHMAAEHIDLPDVAKLARQAGVRAVLLNHLGPETEHMTPSAIAGGVRSGYSGQIVVGEDLQRFCIQPRPAEGSGADPLKQC